MSRLVSSQPVWIQVLELMLLADVVQYGVHRGFHRLPSLWRFHAIHHSIRELDWLAGSRLHLVDVVVTRALVVLPAFVLGFSEPALYTWLVIIAAHGVLNHVNLRFRLRWTEDLVVTPRFHYWHHAVSPPDRNFAVHFPWLDRLFGTHYLPDDRWPEELGVLGSPGAIGLCRATDVSASSELNWARIASMSKKTKAPRRGLCDQGRFQRARRRMIQDLLRSSSPSSTGIRLPGS